MVIASLVLLTVAVVILVLVIAVHDFERDNG